MTALRRLLAGLALAGMVFGAPAALLWMVPPPVGLSWRSLTSDDGTLLLRLVAAVGWLAWAWFAASIVAELLGALTRWRPRIPVLDLPRGLVAGLVVTLLGVGSHVAAAAAAPPLAVAVPLIEHAPVVGSPSDEPAGSAERSAPSSTRDRGRPPVPRITGRSELHTPSREHVVSAGEDLWSLAERYLGDGFAWRQIAAANPDRLTGGPDRLEPGWRLSIPLAAGAPDGATITVSRGDTLASLAATHLGAAERWPELATANAAVLSDPDRLAVGMTLRLPAAAVDTSVAATARPGADPSPVDRRRSPGTATPSATATAPPRAPEAGGGRTTGPQAPTTAARPSGPEGVVHAPLALGVGALLAAGLMTGLAVRRRIQQLHRPLGRRIIPSSTQLARLETALGRTQEPLTLASLDALQRLVHAHCVRLGVPAPVLERVVVGPEAIELSFRRDPAVDPPPPLRSSGAGWRLDAPIGAAFAAPTDSPPAWPALACLGGTDDGEFVLVDLESHAPVVLAGASRELTEGLSTGLIFELACSAWSGEIDLTVVGPPDDFLACAEFPALGYIADPRRAIDSLLWRTAQRSAALRAAGLWASRLEAPDAWRPQIWLFRGDLPEEQLAQVVAAGGPGVVVVLALDGRDDGAIGGERAATLLAEDHPWPLGPRARWRPARGRCGVDDFVPQLIDRPLRESILALFEGTAGDRLERAPWFAPEPPSETPADPIETPADPTETRAHPTGTRADPAETIPSPAPRPARLVARPVVRLLGAIELTGTRGTEPTRARGQCVEYCAWLLAHPGSTAYQMAQALSVAEGTRRSNMSRLRTWLGSDDDGVPFLPDAYSGRIMLRGVDSDWARFRRLTAAGLTHSGDSALAAALELVRGAPLADAAPGQWYWAEGLRTDISGAIRDAAVILGRRALRAGDLDLVRWSAARGLVAAPGDELLLGLLLRVELATGNTAGVERLGEQLRAQAAELDIDLSRDTVELLQQALEGGVRARRVVG